MTLVQRIEEAIFYDDGLDQSDRLQRLFEEADDAGKALLNDAFICLCGYGLSTLILEDK